MSAPSASCGERGKLESDDSKPKQCKRDIDNLEGVWERFIEAFQGLEKILCSVKLKKCNQFCLSGKVKGWLPMITSEEVFDHRRLFYLPKKPHNPTTTASPRQKKNPNQNTKQQKPHSTKSNSCKLKLEKSADVEISTLIIYNGGSSMEGTV